MPIINVTDLNGDVRQITASAGVSLMETLRDEGYEEIVAMCGGCCSCATCHVHIEATSNQALPVMEEDEQLLLELADNYVPQLSRLSCQIMLDEQHDGLQVSMVEPE